jgi:hypothetical protein
MLVGEDAPLSNLYGVWVLTLTFLPFLDAGKSCIVEESETPSLRVFVILLEDVETLALDVLPLSNRFLDQFNVLKELSQNAQES